MRPRAQESAVVFKLFASISWCRISTHLQHIRPSKKLSQPRRSWWVASEWNAGLLRVIADIVERPRARRYFVMQSMSSSPVLFVLSQSLIESTDFTKETERPGSRHLVICVVVSLGHPQLGLLFCYSSIIKSILFVAQKWETCLVIKTQNISGKDFMTLSIPRQYIRSKL